MKRITFLLPAVANVPVGGYKVVYEYANRLVNDGFAVSIVYAAYSKRYDVSMLFNMLRAVKGLFRLFYYRVFGYSTAWFDVDAKVDEQVVMSLSERFVPKSDIYIATSVLTAIELNRWSCDNEKKVYLIQHYENWAGVTDTMLCETYRYPFKKIVISKWLYKIVSQYDPQCVQIPNGFDFDFFKRTTNYADRDSCCLAMLYHTQELKGCADGFKALSIVKQRYPELKVNIFGVAPRPQDLPDWYCYYQQPNREDFNKLYNEASIFVGTSWAEGWGLTVGEAMMCGCAIACTDNDGYKEMVTDGQTALISPIKTPELLADNIIRLIEDSKLREGIANNGYEHIQLFCWDSSYKKLKSLLVG